MHGIYLIIGQDRTDILWWQMVIRGAIIFIYGLTLLRLAGLRAFGRQSALDIMLSVLIGANLSRALTAGSPFFPTLAATAAIVALYWAAIRVAQFSDTAGWIMKGRPVVLIRDGRPDTGAMRQTGVSHFDLDAAIRQAHVAGPQAVACAMLERSGHISVVPREKSRGP
ncbi:MAG TPA: YetF domain-containing protein [Acetobacteraceae bacterium]|nr:YetF domain-containing protein [Acetobacteraceae bacterium]